MVYNISKIIENLKQKKPFLFRSVFNNEKKIIRKKPKNLIICFGGMGMAMGGILPFEFLNYLSKKYTENTDLYFYIDKNQCWYHKGINGISKNIDETVSYLNNMIKNTYYKKIIFMGVSAGGYASILFGSLCNISNVIAFIPITTFKDKMTDSRYFNLKNIINNKTEYILNGDPLNNGGTDWHDILECTNLNCYSNVKIINHKGLNMKTLRNNGTIKLQLDSILN